ncbi:MAG: ATP-binding protein [Proteobacteria bacterium]|nr:ATP-binding protein [Pseudomonadota bacterium]
MKQLSSIMQTSLTMKPEHYVTRLRDTLLNETLFWLGIVSLPAVALSLARIPTMGWRPVFGVQVLLLCMLWLFWLQRHRIAYVWRLGIVLFVMSTAGLTGYIQHGPAAIVGQFLLLFLVIAAVFLRTRQVLWLGLLMFVALLLTAWGAVSGALQFQIDYLSYAHDPANWLMILIAFAGYGGIVALLVRRLVKSLIDQQQQLMQTNANLAARSEEALAANRAKSAFLANMSHELRTPLNGVIGNAQLLELSDPTSEQKEYLSAIMLSGSNLLSLINDILDLSKIEAEKVVLEQKDFSLRGCVNDIVRTQRSRIENKRLSLKLNIPREVPDALVGDELRVKQILLNLLGNAIKFTKEGSITFSAAVKDQSGNNALIELAVTDTGIGIPQAVADDIFKPFVQADSSTTRKYGGSGLGLSISQQLAHLMGGSINVESTEGEGSTFRVFLPFTVLHQVVQESSAPSVEAPTAIWTGAPLKVLLAEDNAINWQLDKALLKKMGHTVTLAENGKEALAALSKDPFDLVLMDIQMPVMNGEEALAVVRERERGTDTRLPVIALTAYALKGDEEKYLGEGFDGYVSKPLEVNKLVAEMHRVLQLKSAAVSDSRRMPAHGIS